jgi:hypothetical protein
MTKGRCLLRSSDYQSGFQEMGQWSESGGATCKERETGR